MGHRDWRVIRRLALLFFAMLALLHLNASAQPIRFDSTSTTTNSSCAPGKQCAVLALPGTQINFCTTAGFSTLTACLSHPLQTFTNASGGTPCPSTAQLTPAIGGACLSTADNQGAYGIWFTPQVAYYYLRVPPGACSGPVCTFGPYPFSFGINGQSSAVTYNQGDSGAITRTVSSKLQEIVSVKDHGATGNGITDDTASIQSAINGANTGTLSFPLGTYVTGALTMRRGVSISCDAGVTFLASSDNEIMFNFGAAVWYSGITGNSGYCTIDGNGHANFQAIGLTGTNAENANMSFSNLYISNAAIGVEATDMILSNLTNVRVFLPTIAAFEFESGTAGINCINCSSIAVLPSPARPYCFLIHNGGSININGTCEGTIQSFIFQEDNVTYNVYHEDSGSPVNVGPWLIIGSQNGTFTQSINVSGSLFNIGADYGVELEQVYGFEDSASSFSTRLGAIYFDNSGDTTAGFRGFRGVHLGSNEYNINQAGYDPTKIVIFANIVQGQDLSNNLSADAVNPLKFTGYLNSGNTVVPPPASMNPGESTVYVDPLTGIMQNQYQSTYLDDVTSCGTYTGSAGPHVWMVTVTALGTPDVIRWNEDGGSYTTGVNLTGSCQTMSSGVGFQAAATTGHGLWETWLITETAGVLSIQRQNTQSVATGDCLYIENIPGTNGIGSRAAGSICAGASNPSDVIISGTAGMQVVGRPGVEMQLGGYNGSSYTDNLVQFPQISHDSSSGTYTSFVCSDSTGHFVIQATSCH